MGLQQPAGPGLKRCWRMMAALAACTPWVAATAVSRPQQMALAVKDVQLTAAALLSGALCHLQPYARLRSATAAACDSCGGRHCADLAVPSIHLLYLHLRQHHECSPWVLPPSNSKWGVSSAGIGVAAFSGCYIYALSYTTLADAFLLTNTHSIILLLHATARDFSVTPLKLVGTLVSTFGAWLTTFDPGEGSATVPHVRPPAAALSASERAGCSV